MISDSIFKEYLVRLGFNSLEINLIYLKSKKTINTAKTLAEVEINIINALSDLFLSGKRIPNRTLESRLNKVFEQNQKVIKSNLEEIYGDKLRRTTDPALKIKNKKVAKDIANSYTKSFNDYIAQGLSVEEASAKLIYKVDLYASTEASRLTAEESDFQLKLKAKSSKWKAVLDKKTCKKCRLLNNRKNPREVPPLHCRCRCYIIYETI